MSFEISNLRERSNSRPVLLDLFCGAGGCSDGYYRAGFDVVGVDLHPQPHYPFQFHQADALTFPLDGFDAVHASPPCQAFTKAQRIRRREHPELVEPIRFRLRASGLPYVIENVPGAPLIEPIELCGAMFGLQVYRHRLFETSFPLLMPPHPEHVARQVKMGRRPAPGEFHQPVGNFTDAAGARAAMDTPWMTRDEMAECVPPAYTEFVGAELRRAVARNRMRAAA